MSKVWDISQNFETKSQNHEIILRIIRFKVTMMGLKAISMRQKVTKMR